MGWKSRFAAKASSKWNQNKVLKQQRNLIKEKVDQGQARYEDRYKDLQRQVRANRKEFLTKGAAVGAAGTVGAAGFVGGKTIGAFRRDLGYNYVIIASLLFYFMLAPFWRVNTYVSLTGFVVMFGLSHLVLVRSETQGKSYWAWIGVILMLDVFLPMIIFMVPFVSEQKWVVTYLINPQILLPWFYFAVVRAQGRTRLAKLAYALIVLLWIGVALSLPMTALALEDFKTPYTMEQVAKAKSVYTKTGDFYWDALTNMGKVWRQGVGYWRTQYRMATGDYYTGQVDENQYDDLGVKIEDIKAADPEFIQGDIVTIWATLKARTLEDGLNINISCYHGRKDDAGKFPDSRKGATNPSSEFVYNQEEIDIDCRFKDSYKMEDETNKITMQADFNFETMSYLKTYFMDQDRLRSLKGQGLDPLDEYKIEDKSPVAKFTNGPVMIGISTVEPPIGLQDANSLKPRLGITLDSNLGWEGKVKQLEELIVMVPESMSLDTTWCTEFEEINLVEYQEKCVSNYQKYRSKQFQDCLEQSDIDSNVIINVNFDVPAEVNECMVTYCSEEFKGHKVYKLKIDEGTRERYANFGYDVEDRQYKTFSCRINLDKPAQILGDAPLSIQYFRVKARYVYQIEETVNVKLKELPEPQRQIVPPPPSQDKINEQISYIFTHYYKSDLGSIKKYCAESGLLGDEKKCACLVMSVISQESHGNINVKDGDGGASKGLMQISNLAAIDAWSLVDGGTCNLYDADCNIKTGIYYMKFNENAGTNLEVDDVAASHNCGLKAFKMIDCAGTQTRAWECPKGNIPQGIAGCVVPNTGAETRNFYVPDVMERYDSCMDMDLLELTRTEPTPDFVKSGIVVVPAYTENIPVRTARIGNTPYWLSVFDPVETASAYVMYGKKAAQYRIASIPLQEGVSKQDNSNPIIKITQNGNSYAYQYIEGSSETLMLVKDKKDAKGIRAYTTAFAGWIDVWYDGDINLYYNGARFCTVPWATHTQRAYGECEEDDIIGIRVVEDMTIPANIAKELYGVEEERAIVQIQIYPAKEDDCCSDCSKCDIQRDLEPELACSTCNNCNALIYDDDYVRCDGGGLSNNIETCCMDCSCTDPQVCMSCDTCTFGWDSCEPTATTESCCVNCDCLSWEDCAACTYCSYQDNRCEPAEEVVMQ